MAEKDNEWVFRQSKIGWFEWSRTSGLLTYSVYLTEYLTSQHDDKHSCSLNEFVDRIFKEDREIFRESFDMLTSGQQPSVKCEIRLQAAQTRWHLVQAYVTETLSSGEVQRISGTITDIDFYKKLQEQHEQAKEELTRYNYTVSHDLRSPLITIKSFVELLEEDIRENNQEGIENDLGYILNAANKMGDLLDELLRLSRVGRVVNVPETITLKKIVENVVELLQGVICERGVDIEVTKGNVKLTGDLPRLQDVFQNLIDNAVKFMGDQPKPKIEIGVEMQDDRPVLFVRDNGMGIDTPYQKKIFGIFERLNPEIPGTGLGLALIHRIINHHQGEIWVESAGKGKGTTFYFYFNDITLDKV